MSVKSTHYLLNNLSHVRSRDILKQRVIRSREVMRHVLPKIGGSENDFPWFNIFQLDWDSMYRSTNGVKLRRVEDGLEVEIFEVFLEGDPRKVARETRLTIYYLMVNDAINDVKRAKRGNGLLTISEAQDNLITAQQLMDTQVYKLSTTR